VTGIPFAFERGLLTRQESTKACVIGIRAMPSARALLVASLLTEPPCGCLGPSGDDRYRKRSLCLKTGVASQVDCQSCACSFAMSRIALCRISPRASGSVGTEFGAAEPAAEDGKIKAPPLGGRMWLVGLVILNVARPGRLAQSSQTSTNSTIRPPSRSKTGFKNDTP
jgi:hypothetical protein